MSFIRYFVAVPRIVLNDKCCSQTDKLVLGIINSLSNNKEYCYASNSYFAKELNVGNKTISQSLSNLKKLNYINIKYEKDKRKIYLNLEIVDKENAKVSEKILPDTLEENFQYKRKEYKRKIDKINKIEPSIEYDTDGIMLWNGKRCEAIPPTEEELEEINVILNQYK